MFCWRMHLPCCWMLDRIRGLKRGLVMWGLPGHGLWGRRGMGGMVMLINIRVLRTPLPLFLSVLPALLPQARVNPRRLPRSNAHPLVLSPQLPNLANARMHNKLVHPLQAGKRMIFLEANAMIYMDKDIQKVNTAARPIIYLLLPQVCRQFHGMQGT